MNLDLQPASDHPLPDLVKFLNLGFEEYLVPVQFSLVQFLTMLRKDNLDLGASRVLLAEDQPAGVALIARRGWTSRLAAMGIAKSWRGKGVGKWFMENLLHEARTRNDRVMVLEVIERNDPAVHLYQKYGFQIVRRLISLIRRDAKESNHTDDLEEIDLREMGRLILQYGLPDLPWQLSGETLALLNPPTRAYRSGSTYAAISDPEAEHVVIWSLLVEPKARGRGLAVDLLKSLMSRHPRRTWHVPAIFPEEFGKVFERAGFQLEELSQWQMSLTL